MSSKLKNTISYRDKQWIDVENKYNLSQPLELVIKTSNHNEHLHIADSSTAKSWGLRLLLAGGIILGAGNIPMQSRLLGNNSASVATTTFEITPSGNETTYTLASYDVSDEDDNYVDISAYSVIEEQPATLALDLPKSAIQTYKAKDINENKSKWVTYHVKSYDNPTNIFYKIGHKDLLKVFQKDETIAKQIKGLKKGSIVRAKTNNGELEELIFTKGIKDSFVITNKDSNYRSSFKSNVFEVRQARTSYIIKNGLFFDGKRAGLAHSVLKQVVKAFDWDIDFSHDVRVGDKVTAIFEEIYHDGDKIGNQHLLAAEFINRDRVFRTIRYTYKDGKSDYFTPQGREMKKAFIRTPIEHARVSSHFNPRRFHPKLHKIVAHKGTDFAARTGTPIMATGNGVIKSIGRKGGYGKTIVIKHRDGYETIYAHMSKYRSGLKVGSKVYQTDIIGYVGSSGLATGPHLHYELHRHSKPVDPMRVKLPNSMSLSKKELKDFRIKAVNYVTQLNVLHRFVEADIEINSAIGG